MKNVCCLSLMFLLASLWCDASVVECFQGQKPMQPTIVTQLADLKSPQVWEDVTIDLVVRPSAGTTTQVEKVKARRVIPRRVPAAIHASLAIIRDRRSGFVHVVRADQTLYLAVGDEMWSCLVANKGVTLVKSYFKMQRSLGNDETLIERFLAEVSNDALQTSYLKQRRISFTPGMPGAFFRTGSDSGSAGLGELTVTAVELADMTLRLELLSDGNKYRGTFWVDLAAQTLVRSVLDGKEVFRAK